MTESKASPLLKTRFTKLMLLSLIGATSLSFASSSYATEEHLIEHPSKDSAFIQDSWIVNYQANDFTDKITEAKVLYIPANYGEQAAIQLRCKPFFTNFSLQYTEKSQNLMDDGELTNDSAKFAKHGYIYDDKQTLKVAVNDDYQTYETSVGGQKNHLTNLFKTQNKIQPGELGMIFFYSFTFQEMPEFRPGGTPDDARDFFKQINQAIKTKTSIEFTLKTKQGWQRQFNWNTQRMMEFVPPEVMDFCLTNRKLK
ncbi:hypothetical protein THMIRHAM_08920 [Thiomicrorhabdus immobilis]|uniref:Uncharacterized protein n=1 Tax=Thiomicrorhabdus immobilis TaxID=2791037 RepID=A0ABM7MCP4_9GAMM|nr:hypothetical protein [Thiomicrorhabdus immobilis]BCN93107.1 hypothetical protein THMIRHAM_08920 [Thiomicrorhabdus immobilis]